MAPLARLIDRVPTRVRLTIAFTVVMAVLLAGAGLFLYLRLGSTLQTTVDRGLRSRAGDVTALIRQADSGLAQAGRSPLTEEGGSLAQIVDARGRIVDASPLLRAKPLLTAGEVRAALTRTILAEHNRSPLEQDRIRLLATPVTAQGRRLVVVVGASLQPVEEAQGELGRLLVVGGPHRASWRRWRGTAPRPGRFGRSSACVAAHETSRPRVPDDDSPCPGRTTRSGGSARP